MFGEGGNFSLSIYFYKMALQQSWFIHTEIVKHFGDSILYLEQFHIQEPIFAVSNYFLSKLSKIFRFTNLTNAWLAGLREYQEKNVL